MGEATKADGGPRLATGIGSSQIRRELDDFFHNGGARLADEAVTAHTAQKALYPAIVP